VEGNETLVPFVAKVVRAFDWGDIGEVITASLMACDGTGSAERCSALEMVLRLAGSLDAGVAQQALLKMATEKAMKLKDSDIFLAKYIGLLWECVVRCGNRELFDGFAKKLEDAAPAVLGPSIQYLSQYLSGVDETDDRVPLLATVRSKRVNWLKEQVEVMDKRFSWEMPDAEFGDSDEIQAFLRGPEITMTMRGVKNQYDELRDARAEAAKWMFGQQVNCSFEAEATEINGDVFVTITKTRQWFLEQQKKLAQYKEELRELTGDTDATGGETKRARLD
jgi:hypothetical protein